MKRLNAVSALMFAGLLASGSASASSIIELGNEGDAVASSIIALGDPDPCADNGCGDETDIAAEDTGSNSPALIDSFGMPTNMPVIMRPSMDGGAGPAEAPADPAAAAPNPQPAATDAGAAGQPAPAEPTATEQPAAPAEGQQPPQSQTSDEVK